jgi:hypothetical protein
MDLNLIWAALFVFLLCILNIIHQLIRKSIAGKPLGCQSIYDSVLKDTFAVMQMYGSYICVLVIISKFGSVQDLFRNNQFLLTSSSLGYSFGFLCQMMSVGSVCIIRKVVTKVCLFQVSHMPCPPCLCLYDRLVSFVRLDDLEKIILPLFKHVVLEKYPVW